MKNPKTMTFDQLIALRDTVDDLIASLAAKVKQEMRAKMTWIDSLTGKRISVQQKNGHALRGRKVPPKYRNPQNHSETWAGRGATPRWLAALVKQGHKPEEFAIAKKARSTKSKAGSQSQRGARKQSSKHRKSA